MAASEAIPEVLAVLLGGIYGDSSGSHATNDFTDAHIRRNETWQGNIGSRMLVRKSIEASRSS